MPTDNTAALQALLNAGPVTLPLNSTYYVTGLNILYNFNLNGSTINFTPTTGTCLRTMTTNITIQNGYLVGAWNYTTANNPSGSTGIISTYDGTTISNMNISQFSAYGISQSGNSVITTYNTLTKIGYIGYFYNSGSSNTSTGTFAYNSIDRSMISNTWTIGVTQPAAAIRGSGSGTQIATLWNIHDNIFTMPSNPIDWSAEGIELRYITHTNVYNNNFIGGSIGLSIINGADYCTNYNNTYTGQNNEALEIGSCISNISYNNTISSQLNVGVLFDGTQSGNTLYDTTITGCVGICVQLTSGVTNLTISNSTISIGHNNQTGIYIGQAHTGLVLTNITISGSGYTGTRGIFFDTSVGGLTMNRGFITSCTYPIMVYAASSGTTTNNLTFNCVNYPVNFTSASLSLNTAGAIGGSITYNNSGCAPVGGIIVNKKIFLI